MNKYRAKVYLGPKSGVSIIDVVASSLNEATNQLKTIYNSSQILSISRDSKSKPNIGIIIFIVVATIIINYTATVFAIIFGLISIKFIKKLSLLSFLSVLLITGFGFKTGELIHNKYFSSPVQKVSQHQLRSETGRDMLNVVSEDSNVYNQHR